MHDGPGQVSAYLSDQLHEHVELVKTAEDASYPWLKLPAKKHFKNSALKSPYECLQDDILQFQERWTYWSGLET